MHPIPALPMPHRKLHYADNDKDNAQNAHVDLVLLRRKQSLGDRGALPEPLWQFNNNFWHASK